MLTLIDGHLDLAMNALLWNRDLERRVHETRQAEEGMPQKGRARGAVAFPEMREARIAISLATVIARVKRPGVPFAGATTQEIAYGQAQGQLAYYRELERQGKLRILKDWPSLVALFEQWDAGATDAPFGIILCMEGADPIVSPEQVPLWWEDGLRVVSISHYGPSAYAYGTGTPGGLTERARPLLEAMERQGMILDLTHLADDAFWQAVDIWGGPVLASHQNCRALVPGDRQFTDDQIRAVIERDGVLGAAMDAWMIAPDFDRSNPDNSGITFETVCDHVDHICQLAGNTRHVAIGTDLDGGYGTEQTPRDLDTICDLHAMLEILRRRGYSDDDVRAIAHGNWLRLFQRAWGGE